MLSITHRATGVFLSLGSVLLVYWLASAAAGPEQYASASALMTSALGRIALFAWTLALYYHLCNGIRHLFWDAGYGYDLDAVTRSGWMVLGGAALLTVLTWAAALSGGGA